MKMYSVKIDPSNNHLQYVEHYFKNKMDALKEAKHLFPQLSGNETLFICTYDFYSAGHLQEFLTDHNAVISDYETYKKKPKVYRTDNLDSPVDTDQEVQDLPEKMNESEDRNAPKETSKSLNKNVWYAVQSYWADESVYNNMEVLEWFKSKEDAKDYAQQLAAQAKQNLSQEDIGYRLVEYKLAHDVDPRKMNYLIKNTIQDFAPVCELESEQPFIQDWQFFKEHSLQNGIALAEAGSLKAGNETFTLLIPNGIGDGEMRWFEIESWYLPEQADFFTCIEGDFGIYHSEKSTQIQAHLSGFYSIYSLDGNIFFVRLTDA
jgi:hypothetical protein